MSNTKMLRFTYAAQFSPDIDDGGFVITFRDLPEAISQGDTVEDCVIEAADCLEEAIAARIDDQLDIPVPTESQGDEYDIPVPLQTAMKAALYIAMKEENISNVELASRLSVNEKEIRRILDPHHGSKLPNMQRALSALNKQAELSIV